MYGKEGMNQVEAVLEMWNSFASLPCKTGENKDQDKKEKQKTR